MLFSINCNILLSSIPVFREQVSFQNGYIRKWDIQKIGYKKKNERKKVFLRMWSSAKWHHLKQNENKIRWSKDAITCAQSTQYIFWKPIFIAPHFYNAFSLTHFIRILYSTWIFRFYFLSTFDIMKNLIKILC